MAKSNKEVLSQIKSTSSAEYQARITAQDGMAVLSQLNEYPTLKNEFITSLTNKVVKTLIFNKDFENKLKRFHKGELPFGASIEQMFVKQAEVKNFSEHFTGSESAEGDLIRKQESTVYVDYISKNYEYKTKVSISEQQLQTAFMDAYGLSSLIAELTASATKALEFQEYKDMRDILLNYPEAKDFKGNPLKNKGSKGTVITTADIPVVSCGSANPKDILKTLRRLSDDVQFLSNKYNASKVETSCEPSDLVFITDSLTRSEIDVDALATVFNLDKAEAKFSTIVIDKLPEGKAGSAVTTGKRCLGFLVDKDFIQSWDIIRNTSTFYNADQMVNNIFSHKHGIMAQTFFVNAIVLTD